MQGLSELKEKFIADILIWAVTAAVLWAGGPIIRKATALFIWQLYDLFIGKRIP